MPGTKTNGKHSGPLIAPNGHNPVGVILRHEASSLSVLHEHGLAALNGNMHGTMGKRTMVLMVCLVKILQETDWKPWRIKDEPPEAAKIREALNFKDWKEMAAKNFDLPFLTARDHNARLLRREGNALKVKEPTPGTEPMKLEKMLAKQASSQKNKYGLDVKTQQYLTTMIFSACVELMELLMETDWSGNGKKRDMKKIRKEVSDAFHFLINIALHAGMDADDIFDSFSEKNKINGSRPKRKLRPLPSAA